IRVGAFCRRDVPVESTPCARFGSNRQFDLCNGRCIASVEPAKEKGRMRLRVPVVLLATLAVSAQERHEGQGVNFYSRQKEAALGAQLAQEVRQRTTPLESAVVRDFV